MNEAIKNMKTRRSVRSFKSQVPDKATIDAIIEAGLAAPSGKNMQSAIVLAITNKEIRDKLSRANASVMGSSGDPFYGAPVILAVLAKRDFPTYVYDGSLVMGNLMLAAHSLGVASCWIHRAREVFEMPEWRDWLRSLGIDDAYEGIGNCVIGYLDGEYPSPKEIREGRVFWVK
jgi:nitroreductase